MVYATCDLVDWLLDFARENDPTPVTVTLAVTPAGDLGIDEPAPDTPVFTHFYMPGAGRSVEAVFGVDLGTPPGRTPGVFVSHPGGELSVDRRDDLREVVLVAVPPWDRGSVAAFGRDGGDRELSLVDAEPPEESVP